MWASVSVPLLIWHTTLLSVPALPVFFSQPLLAICFPEALAKALRLLDIDWNSTSFPYLTNMQTLLCEIILESDKGSCPTWPALRRRTLHFCPGSVMAVSLPSYSQSADSFLCLFRHEIITCFIYIKIAAYYSCIFSLAVLSLTLHCSFGPCEWNAVRCGTQNACVSPALCPSSTAIPTSTLCHPTALGLLALRSSCSLRTLHQWQQAASKQIRL